MPKFLEDKLKKRYGKKSAVPFKIMNSIGAMRGNKETAKGAAMERKHEVKISSPLKSLSGVKKKKAKKKKENPEDAFARAMNR